MFQKKKAWTTYFLSPQLSNATSEAQQMSLFDTASFVQALAERATTKKSK